MQSFGAPIIEANYLGYNDNLPPERLAPGMFSKASNVLLSDNKITKVPGSSTIAPSIATAAFTGFGPFENFASNTKFLIAAINGQGYSWAGSGNFSAITGLTTASTAPMWFETANNLVFGVNGTDEWDWDGASAITKNRSGFPKATMLEWFHNYLFAAGDPGNQNRLYWSNLGDPTTFVTNTNFVDVNPGDGDKIISFGVVQDQLLVFKRNTVWSITGYSGTTFSATTIATQNTNAILLGYGCIAPFSTISTGKDVYFLSYLGNVPVIRSLTLTVFATTLAGGIISHDIDGTMSSINKNAIGGVSTYYDGRYCVWSIPTGSSTTNNELIVLDTYSIRKHAGVTMYPWTTMTGKNASYFAVSTIPGTATIFFSEAGTTGNVLKIDKSVSSDKGNPIKMDAITRSFMPDPARKHKWKYLYFRFDTGVGSNITINANVDEQSVFTLQDTVSTVGPSPGLGPTGTFTLGVSMLGGATRSHHRTTFLHLIGKTMRIEYTESSANPITIYDQEIYHQPKGLRNN